MFVIFFIATLFPVFVSNADVTMPYEPLPMSLRSEYLYVSKMYIRFQTCELAMPIV